MFEVKPFAARTLIWWYAERESVDINPSYQRKAGIWSSTDKAFLIDSILNDFDIPKVYVADFTYRNTALNASNVSYAVIDGKQRFEAIFDFLDGKLNLNDDIVYAADTSVSLGGLSYNMLQAKYPKIARKFDNFNLTVMSVITDDESKVNDLFLRLNRSRALTGAEIRSAMAGQVPVLIKKISEHKFFKTCISFSTKRKQDENSAAKILLVEFRGRFVDTKKVFLDRFAQEGVQAESSDFTAAAQRVLHVLDRMVEVFTEKDPLLSSEGPIVLYYWFVKNHIEFDTEILRDFFLYFEGNRKKIINRKLTGQDTISPVFASKLIRSNLMLQDDEQSSITIRSVSGTTTDVKSNLLFALALEDYSSFSYLNRSTNDQSSLTERYAIIERWFRLLTGDPTEADLERLSAKSK